MNIESDALICVSHVQALRINYVKFLIDKANNSNIRRIHGEMNETICTSY